GGEPKRRQPRSLHRPTDEPRPGSEQGRRPSAPGGQISPPMPGSLMLASPFSRWPAYWYPNWGSPWTVTIRPYRPFVRASDDCSAFVPPAASDSVVLRDEYRSDTVTSAGAEPRFSTSKTIWLSRGPYCARMARPACSPPAPALKRRKNPLGPWTERSYPDMKSQASVS